MSGGAPAFRGDVQILIIAQKPLSDVHVDLPDCRGCEIGVEGNTTIDVVQPGIEESLIKVGGLLPSLPRPCPLQPNRSSPLSRRRSTS